MAQTGFHTDNRIPLTRHLSRYVLENERQSLLAAIADLLSNNDAVLLHMRHLMPSERADAGGRDGLFVTLYDRYFQPRFPGREFFLTTNSGNDSAAVIARIGYRVMEAVTVAWPPYARVDPPAAISDGTGMAICPDRPSLNARELVADLAQARFRLLEILPLATDGTIRRMMTPAAEAASPN
jgi:hypothetical protein